jgi:hypothetical protein
MPELPIRPTTISCRSCKSEAVLRSEAVAVATDFIRHSNDAFA